MSSPQNAFIVRRNPVNAAKWPRLAAILLGLTAALLPVQGADLAHLYQFQGTLSDTIGSVSLVNNGATLGADGLTFSANHGPTLDAESSLAANYSIGIRFELNHTGQDWRKIIDYKDLTSDMGAYSYTDGHVQFVANTGGPSNDFHDGPTPIPFNTTVEVVFTRDGANKQFSAYLNGSLTPEFTFTDTSNDAVATLVSGQSRFNFFIDDNATGQGEATSGIVSEIRVWNGALAPAEIPGAFQAVPEPSVVILSLLGALVLKTRMSR